MTDDKPTRDELLAQARETAERIAADSRAKLADEREKHPVSAETLALEAAARAKAVYKRARARKYKPLPVTYQRKSK